MRIFIVKISQNNCMYIKAYTYTGYLFFEGYNILLGSFTIDGSLIAQHLIKVKKIVN